MGSLLIVMGTLESGIFFMFSPRSNDHVFCLLRVDGHEFFSSPIEYFDRQQRAVVLKEHCHNMHQTHEYKCHLQIYHKFHETHLRGDR